MGELSKLPVRCGIWRGVSKIYKTQRIWVPEGDSSSPSPGINGFVGGSPSGPDGPILRAFSIDKGLSRG